jgi:hypothetical protein
MALRTCKTCGVTFDDSKTESIKEHNGWHKLAVDLSRQLNETLGFEALAPKRRARSKKPRGKVISLRPPGPSTTTCRSEDRGMKAVN